jgi:deoxyribonuclease-4
MKSMPLLGAHMSIAGGYYKAVDAAADLGMETVQVFTKNNNQWRARPIGDDEAKLFRDRAAERNVRHTLSHSSYLINVASPDAELWQKSVDAFVVELERAARLGIPHVVLHPGAYVTGSEEEGLARVIRAFDEIHRRAAKIAANCLIETTAGQGSCLGWKFEHLASMLEGVRDSDRLGVCVDTCHLFAAGYPLGSRKEYLATIRRFDDLIGLERIKAIHLNDSKRELGSRVDRHEHIGHGKIGLEAFSHLLNDRRFRDVPMYLETPKADYHGEPWDAINLRTLRSLVNRKRATRQATG